MRETASCRHARSTCSWACALAAGCCSFTGAACRNGSWVSSPIGGGKWCGPGPIGWIETCSQVTPTRPNYKMQGVRVTRQGSGGSHGPESTRTVAAGWTLALILPDVKGRAAFGSTSIRQRRANGCLRVTARSSPRSQSHDISHRTLERHVCSCWALIRWIGTSFRRSSCPTWTSELEVTRSGTMGRTMSSSTFIPEPGPTTPEDLSFNVGQAILAKASLNTGTLPTGL